MQTSNSLKTLFAILAVLAAIYAGSSLAPAGERFDSTAAAETKSQGCANDDSGLKLPAGFCATVFADNIGHARHLVVSPSGVVYVNTWSGVYYNSGPVPSGGFLVALKDTQNTGKADVVKRFGEGKAEGAAGGTGIALYHGAIYAEVNDRIMRYALAA